MKRLLLFLFLFPLLVNTSALAQTPAHKATLNYGASPDAVVNPSITYNVYRSVGPCPLTGSPTTLVRIGSTLAGVLTYVDSNVQAGQTYCYIVRAVLNGAESVDSNTFGAVIPLAPSSGLTVVTQ